MADVDVWCARGGDLAVLAECLDEQERARAEALRVADARLRFVGGRVLLRHALARRLGRPPAVLRFDTRGKPALVGGGEGVEFNVAHSADLVVVAVGEGPGIGVDIERIRPLPEAMAIARAHFPPTERDGFLAAPSPQAFFTAWTSLEARVKATGRGMAGVRDATGTAVTWQPAVGYVGAVAVAEGEPRLRLRDVAELVGGGRAGPC